MPFTMDPQNLLVGGRSWLEPQEPIGKRLQSTLDGHEPLGSLGVAFGRNVLPESRVADDQNSIVGFGHAPHGSSRLTPTPAYPIPDHVSPRRLPRSVAITGLESFVGLRLAERLLASSAPPHLVGLDLRVPRRLEGRLRFHRVDLTEPTADSVVAEILEKERCEAVVHAAFLQRPYADREYLHELEVIGSLHVMNAAAVAGVRKLVVTSTAQVYGAHPDNPNFLTEAHPLRAQRDAHAVRARAEMDTLLGLFAERHPSLVVSSLRPCWVMGPSIDSSVIDHFGSERVTTLLGFDPLLQFIHEEDLIDAAELALTVDAPGPLNLAGEAALPLSTLLRLAGKKRRPIPHPLLYRLDYLPSLWRSGDPPAGFFDFLRFLWVVDTARASELLGFRPRYSTKEAWMSFVVSRRLRRYR